MKKSWRTQSVWGQYTPTCNSISSLFQVWPGTWEETLVWQTPQSDIYLKNICSLTSVQTVVTQGHSWGPTLFTLNDQNVCIDTFLLVFYSCTFLIPRSIFFVWNWKRINIWFLNIICLWKLEIYQIQSFYFEGPTHRQSYYYVTSQLLFIFYPWLNAQAGLWSCKVW